MKKISKILAILSVFVLALSLNTYAKQKTYLFVDGNHIKTDAEPFIENGRTLVPIRFISENLKNKVDWNSDEKKVTVTPEEEKEISKIELVIGSDVAKLYDKDGNIKEEKLEVPAKITNSRTFVPVRFISETLGTEVNWDPENRVVIIGDKTKYNSEKFKNEVIAKEPKEKQEPVKKQETKKVAKTNTKTKEFNYGGEKYVPTYTQNRVEVFKKIDKILGVKRDKDGWGRATLYYPTEKRNKEYWFAPLTNNWTKNKTAEECYNLFMDRVGNDLSSFEIPLEAKYLLIDLNKDVLTKFKESGYNSNYPKEAVIELMNEINNREAVKTNKKSKKYNQSARNIYRNMFRTYQMGVIEDVWSMPDFTGTGFTTFNPDRDSILYSRIFGRPLIALHKGNIDYGKANLDEEAWWPIIQNNDLTYSTTLGEIVQKYPGNINRNGLFVDTDRDFLKVYSPSNSTVLDNNTKIYKSNKKYPISSISMGYNKKLNNYYIDSLVDCIKYPGSRALARTYILDTNNSITVETTQGASFTEPYKKLIGNMDNKTIEGKKIKYIIEYYGGNNDKIVGLMNDVDIYIPTMDEVWDK
ncbi:copper amine oxidase N-terminal domain-containing protein [Peptoniphilus duerdenii]|uniref:copper amine oxidase N-terminal domain-containing protein n=1 Tax=Peptoniphilus duerdenii TaxID=507750 RepID=UPI00288B9202|nr:copper amine oxidase N-terminal domain-containing protein [Peptoniphilus duerdenii]